MSMCDGPYEIKHFEELEEAYDDGIPLDEDYHLHDYDYDELTAHLQTCEAERIEEEKYIQYLISTGEV